MVLEQRTNEALFPSWWQRWIFFPFVRLLITQCRASLWEENLEQTDWHSWKWANYCVHKVFFILWSEHRFPSTAQCIANAEPPLKECKCVAGFFSNQKRRNCLIVWQMVMSLFCWDIWKLVLSYLQGNLNLHSRVDLVIKKCPVQGLCSSLDWKFRGKTGKM